ncbi:MAG TPA: FdrA family protein [Anaerolineae bacterium]|nr:FdrA family protein [Anaerolineae bacterium]
MAVLCRRKDHQYYDSVTLMTVARQLKSLPGIEDAALVMGTIANKDLLRQVELFTPEVEDATSSDLIIVLKGDGASVRQAIDKAEVLLTRRTIQTKTIEEHLPRTLRSAIRLYPESNLAVISLPGQHAVSETWHALHHGLHVLLFSDNVSLADEIALKRYAVDNNLLMMGPGAGTAIINGVALGFGNALPRGPVGIASAAGTGLQEVSTLLAKQGVGISQGIGVGGRDLSDEVDAMMMIQAIEALQTDQETEVIVAISKLPTPRVAEKVGAKLNAGKPAVVIFMGESLTPSPYAKQIDQGRIIYTSTLQEAALKAAMLATDGDLATVESQLAQQMSDLQKQARNLASLIKPEQKFLRGLFSGGTLCEEAMRIWDEKVRPVWSNQPLKQEWKLPDSKSSYQHCALDLGAEEFTVGRPHPMIDHDLRITRLLEEASDPSVAVIQMDVVLGYGAHPDPASELSPAIEKANGIALENERSLIVVLSITGTNEDPQNVGDQQDAFQKAGAIVLESNAAASWLAAMVVEELILE